MSEAEIIKNNNENNIISTYSIPRNRLQTNILDVRKLFESKFPETRPRRGSDLKRETRPRRGSDLKRETRPRRGSDLIRENPSKENASQSSPKIDTIKFIIPEISYNITSVFLENIKKLFSQDTIYLTTMLPKEIAIVGVRNNVLNKLINLVAFTRIPSVTARC